MLSAFLWMLLGALLSLAMVWLSRKIRGHFLRRRYGDDPKFEEWLSRYSRQLAGMIEDRQHMVKLLSAELPQMLGIERAAVLFLEGQELMAPGNGNSPGAPLYADLRLPINHMAVRRVAASGEATPVNPELERLVGQGRTDLRWVAVWVPIMRGARLYGLWLLGVRRQDRAYTPAHLQWFTTLAHQVALVLQAVSHAEREQTTARQIQALYHQAVSAGEIERQRLARELHDGVLQDLCALARDLKALTHDPDAAPLQQETLIWYADNTVAALRAICHNLRPPFLTNNLALTLRALVERLDGRTDAAISFKTNVDTLDLPEESIIAIYRIAQEALTNAIQHAQASEILVRLTRYPGALRLTVHDDSCGIPAVNGVHGNDPGRFVSEGHFGLAGMSERAKMIGASLDIHSATDYGTAVILYLSTT